MATIARCLFCLLFYSRVTNYAIFGHCAMTFQMSEHYVGEPLVLSQGYVHVCVWACSILLCPGFHLVPAHVSLDPPLSYLLQKTVEASADLEIND